MVQYDLSTIKKQWPLSRHVNPLLEVAAAILAWRKRVASTSRFCTNACAFANRRNAKRWFLTVFSPPNSSTTDASRRYRHVKAE